MRFQAFSSLAYGAEVIFWGCYSDGAWWYKNVLTIEGEKTEQYEKLKAVNSELKVIGDQYMKYRNIETHYVGDFGADLPDNAVSYGNKISAGSFLNVREENDNRILVGEMVSREHDGSCAILVATVDDYMDESPSVSRVKLDVMYKDVELVASDASTTLERIGEGSYLLTMTSNRCALLIAR